MANPVAETLREAARLNSDDPRREGNVVNLGEAGDVIVAGDLHGNRTGLGKLTAHADLPHHPERILVLQEIIHGPSDPRTGQDRSIEVLQRAVRLKVSHPGQVLFLLSNHDIAQLTGNEIMKEGRGCCQAFREGLEYCYPDATAEIYGALEEFLRSQPLALRTGNGVFAAHSLPAPPRQELAGTEILSRPYAEDDCHRGGALYEWTWGRGQTDEQLDALAAELGVELFVLGHVPCESGYEVLGPRCIVLAADHPRGAACQLPIGPSPTAQDAEAGILPLAKLARRGT